MIPNCTAKIPIEAQAINWGEPTGKDAGENVLNAARTGCADRPCQQTVEERGHPTGATAAVHGELRVEEAGSGLCLEEVKTRGGAT